LKFSGKTQSGSKGRLSQFISGIKEKKQLLKDLESSTGKLVAEDFPLLPLRELVLFPQTVIPIFITFKPGMAAIEQALARDNRLFAACLKKQDGAGSSTEEEPVEFGTVVRLVQHLKLPDNTYRVVLQGEYRGTIVSLTANTSYSMVHVEPIKTIGLSEPFTAEDLAIIRSLQKSFSQYAEFSKKVNTDTISAVERTENPERLANLVCNAVNLKPDKKIELLKIADTRNRLLAILETIELENEIYGIQKNISGKVKSRMDKSQREYILNEQLKEINKELGKENTEDEFALMEKILRKKNLL